jgi:hypothetical protein
MKKMPDLESQTQSAILKSLIVSCEASFSFDWAYLNLKELRDS